MKVEARNYDIRKQVVEFDDVMNDQRTVIYDQRADIMDAEDVSDIIANMRAETAESLVMVSCPEGTYPEQWDVAGLKENLDVIFGLQPPVDDWLQEEEVDQQIIVERVQALPTAWPPGRDMGGPLIRLAPAAAPTSIRTGEHLATRRVRSDHLRSTLEKTDRRYKQEAFLLFERLLISIREDVTKLLMRAQVQFEAPPPPLLPDFITQHLDPFSGDDDTADIDAATGAVMSRIPAPMLNIPQPQMPAGTADGDLQEAPVSRNAPCPCGSGQKYKHCHGRLA